jgi:hypothetical protein
MLERICRKGCRWTAELLLRERMPAALILCGFGSGNVLASYQR